MNEEQKNLGVEFVDGLAAQFGRFPKTRAIHAKGQGAAGTFTSNGAGAEFCCAPHLKPGTFSVRARFSNGDGNPHASDGGTFSRGFAVRFFTSDTHFTDLLSIVSPTFITPDPLVFLAFIHALKPDPVSKKPDAFRLGEFALLHPITMGHVIAQQKAEVPKSFATTAWHAVHAFPLTSASGVNCHARFHWKPAATPATLARAEAEKLGLNYLMEDAKERLSGSAMEFDLVLTLAENGDPLDRPDKRWPEDRRQVSLGRLRLDSVFDAESMCFSPDHLLEGMAAPSDQIFPARLKAYAVSQTRRSDSESQE